MPSRGAQAGDRGGQEVVGAPKHLADLRRIEADVQVTCRACGRRRVLDRERLIGDLIARAKNLTWEAVKHQLRCRCGARNVAILPVPFSTGQPPTEFKLFVLRTNELIAAFRESSSGRPEDVGPAQRAWEAARDDLAAWCLSHR